MPAGNAALLRRRADEFRASLAAHGFSGRILARSLRAYSLKVAVARAADPCGNAVIYYSPKKKRFTLHRGELRHSATAIEAIWNGEEPSGAAERSEPGAALTAYVDGSLTPRGVGWGAVIVEEIPNPQSQIPTVRVRDELSGRPDEVDDATRQVVGELAAVRAVAEWCRAHGIGAITIAHDYDGVAKWPTGEWRAKQPLTRDYAAFIRGCGIQFGWRKVEAHTGDRWNERADLLARREASRG